jgi:hypothetical protein
LGVQLDDSYDFLDEKYRQIFRGGKRRDAARYLAWEGHLPGSPAMTGPRRPGLSMNSVTRDGRGVSGPLPDGSDLFAITVFLANGALASSLQRQSFYSRGALPRRCSAPYIIQRQV